MEIVTIVYNVKIFLLMLPPSSKRLQLFFLELLINNALLLNNIFSKLMTAVKLQMEFFDGLEISENYYFIENLFFNIKNHSSQYSHNQIDQRE